MSLSFFCRRVFTCVRVMFSLTAMLPNKHGPRYTIANTNWNGPTPLAAALPPELLPFSTADRLTVTAAPLVGVWKQGAVVWAVMPTLNLAGWYCNVSGAPGQWVGFGLAPAM